MKRLVLATAFVILLAFAVGAQGAPKAGEFGVQGAVIFTSVGGTSAGDVGVKYVITDKIAVRAGLGLLSQSSGGNSASFYSLGVGFEYHLAPKAGVSPYAGGELSYSGESLSSGGTTPTDFAIAGVFGGEYFFSPNFSWAGEARVGFDSSSTVGTTTTTIGTFGFATFLTWFVN
ncbi:MAG TPA: outer membrane beta-barrel protein [Rectinemataceae bacterium]|nr:outer membrane beta-barrel protein [Rectinemataceae bacterium]